MTFSDVPLTILWNRVQIARMFCGRLFSLPKGGVSSMSLLDSTKDEIPSNEGLGSSARDLMQIDTHTISDPLLQKAAESLNSVADHDLFLDAR